MRPRYIALHESLPYTATKKLQRGRLKPFDAPTWDIEIGGWVDGPEQGLAAPDLSSESAATSDAATASSTTQSQAHQGASRTWEGASR